MQKIKIGYRAKFRDRDNFFLQVLFPFRAILCRIFTSGVLHALLLIDADAYFLVMACEFGVCRLLALAAKNPFEPP